MFGGDTPSYGTLSVDGEEQPPSQGTRDQRIHTDVLDPPRLAFIAPCARRLLPSKNHPLPLLRRRSLSRLQHKSQSRLAVLARPSLSLSPPPHPLHLSPLASTTTPFAMTYTSDEYDENDDVRELNSIPLPPTGSNSSRNNGDRLIRRRSSKGLQTHPSTRCS